MSASIRQFAFHDMPGTGNSHQCVLGSPTLAGSAIHVQCRSAWDAETNVLNAQGVMTDNIGTATYNLKAQLIDSAGNVNCVETLFVAENVPAGMQTFTMSTFSGHDFEFVLVIEITGVTTTPFLGANKAEVTTSGVQSISTGTISASSNAFIVATCVNEQETGATPYAPLADTGAGFSSAGTFNNYSLGLGDFGRIESKAVSANAAATFISNGTDIFMAFGAAYQVLGAAPLASQVCL